MTVSCLHCYEPLPVRLAVCGLPTALSDTLSVPFLVPIPVGLNVIHRRLGTRLAEKISALVCESMHCANQHSDEASAWALKYSRQAEAGIGEHFIRMFANADTLCLGEDCRRALDILYRRALEHGLIRALPAIEII